MDFAAEPIDSTSADALAAEGLRLALVDTGDRDGFAAWYQADARGFYGPRMTDAQFQIRVERAAYRRTTGVWDAGSADPLTPVATVSTWPTPLTVPASPTLPSEDRSERPFDGLRDREQAHRDQSTAAAGIRTRTIAAWAISSVTVAPTHRRRGIARALLEAELRTAHRLGVPLAMLTASEATIYGRFGFAPAAFAADVTIETRRVRWNGPATPGRLHFIGLDDLRTQGRAVYEAARRLTPGEIELDELLWEELIGTLGEGDADPKNLRAVRYDDERGIAQGFALYRLSGGETDFTKHTAHVLYLGMATDEAYAALWRYVLELDLIDTVEAPLRSVDEPVLRMIGDQRAARVRRGDHLWLRMLDVAATLTARGYAAPGRIAFDVTDPLGFADGCVLLTIDEDGRGSVDSITGDGPSEVARVALGVDDLAALYLGGTSAVTLARAGRVTELREGSADAVDAAFRSSRTPWLSTWF
jgi:Predicted acetyltransferase involved in intracellular survival and related acetyltransferases